MLDSRSNVQLSRAGARLIYPSQKNVLRTPGACPEFSYRSNYFALGPGSPKKLLLMGALIRRLSSGNLLCIYSCRTFLIYDTYIFFYSHQTGCILKSMMRDKRIWVISEFFPGNLSNSIMEIHRWQFIMPSVAGGRARASERAGLRKLKRFVKRFIVRVWSIVLLNPVGHEVGL